MLLGPELEAARAWPTRWPVKANYGLRPGRRRAIRWFSQYASGILVELAELPEAAPTKHSQQWRPEIPQHAIELILLRQWASCFALPVFILGADGQLLYYNGPAEEMLGRRFDEAGEMSVDQLSGIFQTRDEDGSPMPPEALPIGIALGERRPAHRRFQYWGLDGAWRMVETTALPLAGQGGQHLGAVAIWWEVEGG